jgi:anti-sigma regulatory factor (Ser/Thr protein kinase)
VVEELLCVSVRCDEFASRTVREALTGCSAFGPVLADAMLVASELVSNAIRHSLCRDDEFLTVSLGREGSLRISVRDPGRSGVDARVVDRPLGLGGYGLKIVEELAARWGAERRGNGYEVWAELQPGLASAHRRRATRLRAE